MEVLDFCGPFEVFASVRLNEEMRRETDSPIRQYLVAESAEPVRVFAIAYGDEADVGALRDIAEASNAALYNASDPATISRILAAVISNF